MLWFSCLAGLVMLFMFLAFFSLLVYGSYPYAPIEYPLWLALVFIIQMITIFCIYSLLAGLVQSVSSGSSGRTITLREGLSAVRSHVRSIAGWSAGMAVLGTSLLFIGIRYSGFLFVTISPIIGQFPFYFILTPEILGPGPIPTVVNPLSAATFTIIATIINVFTFILTLFVVPVLVLENKRLPGAVAESIALVKRVWGEIITCFLISGLVLLGISLTSLLFRVAYGVVSFDDLFFWYQGGWIAVAALYMLVWYILVMIGSTVVGISLTGLYTYAKNSRMPGTLEEKPDERVPQQLSGTPGFSPR